MYHLNGNNKKFSLYRKFQAKLQLLNISMADFQASPMTLFAALGVGGGMQMLTHDSFASVIDCKWSMNQSIPCKNLFLNHMTDYGWCFTFNPSVDLLQAHRLPPESMPTAYGMTPNTRQEL